MIIDQELEKLLDAMLSLKKCKTLDLQGNDGIQDTNGIRHFKDPCKAKLLAALEGCEDDVLEAIDTLESMSNG